MIGLEPSPKILVKSFDTNKGAADAKFVLCQHSLVALISFVTQNGVAQFRSTAMPFFCYFLTIGLRKLKISNLIGNISFTVL